MNEVRLIDANALKKAFNKWWGCDDIPATVVEDIIDNAPTVDTTCPNCDSPYAQGYSDGYLKGKEERPQGEWIPVSERLPDNRDWYLGVFREPDTGFIGIPFICDYVGKITKGTTKEGWILRGFTDTDNPHEYYMCLECVAWQPLPESYKEGGSE